MTLTASDRSLLDTVFAAIDAKDTDRFLSCISRQASFRFGSASPVSGHDAIRDAVGGFFDTVAGLSHVLLKSAAIGSTTGPTLICEGEVTYTRHDETRITLPFVDVFETRDGLISDYKIYMDITPLYTE